MSGQHHADEQLEGATFSRNIKVRISHRGLGWCLALAQIQSPRLASSVVWTNRYRVMGKKVRRNLGGWHQEM